MTSPRGRRRTLRILLVLVVGSATAGYLARDTSPAGHWRNAAGREAYETSYTAAMGLLPAPGRTLDVATTFGTVRVYRFGPLGAGGPASGGPASGGPATRVPLLLLPGRSSGVPMWSENLRDLADGRTVYALDALGDAGMGVQTRRLRDGADQAAWLDEVLVDLGLDRVHLVGHSFGGWLAANYAARRPGRVASLVLLEPVFVLQGLRWQIYVRSVPVALPFLPRSWREHFLAGGGGVDELDPDDPVGRMISDGAEHYAPKLPVPERLSEAQLRGLRMPVYVALGGRSALHDAAAAERVARGTVPDLRLRTWADATHSLPMEHPAQVDADVLGFVAEHDASAPGAA